MTLTEIRQEEREALCRTLSQVGPGAPTLCSKWTTAELAAHLVVSERYGGLPLVVAYPLRRALPTQVRERAMASRSTRSGGTSSIFSSNWKPLCSSW